MEGFTFLIHDQIGRKGTKSSLIPDIVAVKDNDILLIESKPRFNIKDKEKLDSLFKNSIKLNILKSVLFERCKESGIEVKVNEMNFIKSLAYSKGKEIPPDFIIFKVLESKEVIIYIGKNLSNSLKSLFQKNEKEN